MYICSQCGNAIGENQWRIERYRLVFCDNNCLGFYASKLEPQDFGSLTTRLIPKPTAAQLQERRSSISP